MIYQDIKGYFDFEEMYNHAIANYGYKGACFVEVGALFGKSTGYLGKAIKEANKDMTLFVVDTWEGSPNDETGQLVHFLKDYGFSIYDKFVENMKALDVLDVIVPIRDDSVSAARAFDTSTLAFVFIDADHTYDSVTADLKAWWPKIKQFGGIAGHDYFSYQDVNKAVNDFFIERNREVKVMGSCWYVERN